MKPTMKALSVVLAFAVLGMSLPDAANAGKARETVAKILKFVKDHRKPGTLPSPTPKPPPNPGPTPTSTPTPTPTPHPTPTPTPTPPPTPPTPPPPPTPTHTPTPTPTPPHPTTHAQVPGTVAYDIEEAMAQWLVAYGPVSVGVDAMTQLWYAVSVRMLV